MRDLVSGWMEALQTVRHGIGYRAALTGIPPSTYYSNRLHFGGWLGYYGVFILTFAALPDAVVWLVGGLVYRQDWLTLVGLSLMIPVVARWTWQFYLRLSGGWLGK